MKHMLFRYRCNLVVFLLVFLAPLSGCSPFKSKKATVVTVWTNSTQTKSVFNLLIDGFNNGIGRKDGIRIEYKVFGDDYKNNLDDAANRGALPDLYHEMESLYNLEAKGQVVPIDDMPGGPEFLKRYERYIRVVRNRVNKKTYTVPFGITTVGLIYNKDLFVDADIVDEEGHARPPRTWDEVSACALKLTNKSKGVYGIALPVKWIGFFDWNVVIPFSASNGMDYYNFSNGTYQFNKLNDGLSMLMNIRSSGGCFPGSDGLDHDTSRALFADGKIGMILGASWDVGSFSSQFYTSANWGVAPLPVMHTDDVYKQWSLSESLLAISPNALKNNIQKVMEVYKWFNSDEVLLELYKNQMVIPYNTELIKDSGIEPNSQWKTFCDLMKISEIYPNSPPVNISGASHYVVFADIWSGKTPVYEGLRDLDNRYNAALSAGVQSENINMEDYRSPAWDIRISNKERELLYR